MRPSPKSGPRRIGPAANRGVIEREWQHDAPVGRSARHLTKVSKLSIALILSQRFPFFTIGIFMDSSLKLQFSLVEEIDGSHLTESTVEYITLTELEQNR